MARLEPLTSVIVIVIVEGASDREAVVAFAKLRGRDLAAEGISVVAIGGAHAAGRFVAQVRGQHPRARLVGLVDAGEEPSFARAGLASVVCDPDLEAELIAALGAQRVERVIEAQGELAAWRSFQKQPYHRDRPVEAQLRRFLGTLAGRKIAYGRLLVEALDAGAGPPPLELLLSRLPSSA
ncbi:MAG TPA: TOPRIM nucleotidyl transferase/hydrolase domain-containing protein [Candidatus Dormibacteraeota bacterium]